MTYKTGFRVLLVLAGLSAAVNIHAAVVIPRLIKENLNLKAERITAEFDRTALEVAFQDCVMNSKPR